MEEINNYGQKIIKLDEVEKKFTKSVGDKLFFFECTLDNGDELRLCLKEINCYSPYYYEVKYSYTDIIQKYSSYEGLDSIERIKESMDLLFPKQSTRLELSENEKKIIIHTETINMEIPIKLDFELERKTIENIDDALHFLYEIEKNNYNLIEKIKEICKKEMEKNDKVAQEILRDLTTKFENYY